MMEEKNWLDILNKQTQLKQIEDLNRQTEQFGLVLGKEDTELLLEERQNILKQARRVEFGQGILPKIIFAFCDSEYIMQDNYVQSLIRLQEIFYHYKNEMEDVITDDELLNFMKEQFDTTCFGDFSYLEGTCLELFSEAVRAGYRGYQKTEGIGEFEKLDIVTRWDREVYLEALKDLF